MLKQVGYNPLKFFNLCICTQSSPDIAAGVKYCTGSTEMGINEQYGSIGAGDQGTMYGYATNRN